MTLLPTQFKLMEYVCSSCSKAFYVESQFAWTNELPCRAEEKCKGTSYASSEIEGMKKPEVKINVMK